MNLIEVNDVFYNYYPKDSANPKYEVSTDSVFINLDHIVSISPVNVGYIKDTYNLRVLEDSPILVQSAAISRRLGL